MTTRTLPTLLDEYDRAVAWTDSMWIDLSAKQVAWRPHAESSAIGWHLGRTGRQSGRRETIKQRQLA